MQLTSIKLKEANQSLLNTFNKVSLIFEEETSTQENPHKFLILTSLEEAKNLLSKVSNPHISIFTYLKSNPTNELNLSDVLIYKRMDGLDSINNQVYNTSISEKLDSQKDVLVQNDVVLKEERLEGKSEVPIKKLEEYVEAEPIEFESESKINKPIDTELISGGKTMNSKINLGHAKEELDIQRDELSLKDVYMQYIKDTHGNIEFNDLEFEGKDKLNYKFKNILRVAFDYGRLMRERGDNISLQQSYLKTTSSQRILDLQDEVRDILNVEGYSNCDFIFERYFEEVLNYDGIIFKSYISAISEKI